MGAYISQYGDLQVTNSADLTYDMSALEYEAGDYLVLISSVARGGSVEIDTKPSGWTDIISQGQLGKSAYVGYLKASSSSESNPTFGGINDHVCAIVIVIKGADGSTFVDASTSTTTGYVRGGNLASVTTTADDELVILGMASRDDEAVRLTNAYRYNPISQNSSVQVESGIACNLAAWSFVQGVAGATPSDIEYYTEYDDNVKWAFAIKNASGASSQIQISSDTENVYLGGLYEEYQGTGSNVSDLSVLASTIDSKTVIAISPTIDHTNAPDSRGGSKDLVAWSQPVGNAADTYEGFIVDLGASKDIDGEVVTWIWEHRNYGFVDNLEPWHVMFIDSSGNWEIFNFGGSVSGTPSYGQKRCFINPSAETAYDSSGTIDYTDIDRIAFAYLMDNTGTNSRNAEFRGIFNWKTTTFVGGNSTAPITPRAIIDTCVDRAFEIDLGVSQGIGQDALAIPLRIGDGTTPTYYSQQTSSLEWRDPDQDTYLLVNASEFPFEIYASASDTMDFSASITASSSSVPFTINASSSTSATWNFQGWSAIGLDITWLDGLSCTGASFINSTVNGKAGLFNRCVFSRSAGTTYALEIDDGAEVIGCTFTKDTETYALNIREAGDYDLTGTEFSGYTTDVYVSAATGTVNITTDQTITTASAGATVNVITPTASVILNGVVSGSRVLVAAEAGGPDPVGTEYLNAIVTTDPYTLPMSVANQPLKVVVAKSSAAPYYKQWRSFPTIGAVDLNLYVSQELDQ
jgi:hypothetical protein